MSVIPDAVWGVGVWGLSGWDLCEVLPKDIWPEVYTLDRPAREVAPPIIVKAHDFGYFLTVAMRRNGEAQNLEGCTATLHIWDQFDPEVTRWSLPGYVVDPEGGVVLFDVTEGCCNAPGVYCCEGEILRDGVGRESTDTYRVLVKESPMGVLT